MPRIGSPPPECVYPKPYDFHAGVLPMELVCDEDDNASPPD